MPKFTDTYHPRKPTDHGYWTVMQLLHAMMNEAVACTEAGRDYQRFVVRFHYGELGRTSELMAVEHIQFEEHCITIKGTVHPDFRQGKDGHGIRHQGVTTNYDGIEVVRRVPWQDENWHDWLD